MGTLNLAMNNFSGSLDLTKLPTGIAFLYLNNNSFSGPVDLTKLPSGVQRIDLRFNSQICGAGIIYNGTIASCMSRHVFLPSHCSVNQSMCSYNCGSC